MNDLDKMARELLGSEWRKLTDHEGAAEELESGCELPPIVSASVAAIRTALLTAPPGYVLVPVGLIHAFPEINPSNYDHDQACNLNAWGCQVVTAAAQEPEA